MIAFIEGKLVARFPTYVILEAGGIGYQIHISLFTFAALPEGGGPVGASPEPESLRVRLHVIQIIREDSFTLYGFATEGEKNLFSHLISVSGIGPSTGRMILSSMDPSEIQQAIVKGDVARMQQIKGIGTKSAQRIILELQDKLKKDGSDSVFAAPKNNGSSREEALSALVTLGFMRSAAEKAIEKVLTSSNQALAVDILIKSALKNL